MRIDPKNFVIVAVLALVAGLIAWWWYETTELRWQQEYTFSDAYRAKPFLASSMLLRQHGHSVRTEESLDLINLEKLPDGLLILGGENGRGAVTSSARAELVRAWVARGNTLIFSPRERTRAEREAAEKAKKDKADAQAAGAPAAGEPAAGEPAAGDPAQETSEENNAGESDGDSTAAEEDATTEGDAADEEVAEDVADPANAADAEAAEDDEEDADDPAPASRVAPRRARAAATETDPLSAQFGVRRAFVHERTLCRTLTKSVADSEKDDKCPPGTVRARNLRMVQVPGMDPVSFDTPFVVEAMPGSPQPVWADNQGNGLRAYRHGKGHVIAMSTAMLRNLDLVAHDHGALLLALASLNPRKHVVVIESAQAVGWQRLLWQHFSAVIVGLAVLGALLFWAGVRRFGPAMPEPAPERRSLMEHINASGAWLWKVRGGRQVLIDAARADLQATLQRRAPALLRLHSQQQHKELAALTGLSEDDIASAMLDEPSAIEPNFTRQIRTLQTLRSHHER